MSELQNACPKCGKERIMGEYANWDGNEIWRTVYCQDCGFKWNEIYTFSHNEDVNNCKKLDF